MRKKLNRFITFNEGTKYISYPSLYDINGNAINEGLLRMDQIGVIEQEDWYGYIYLTIIPESNKAYIGKHKGKADVSYKGSGRILKKAVDKYGEENIFTFLLEPLKKDNKSEKELATELHDLESQWIKHKLGINIESSSISEFYNLTTGFTKVNMEKQVKEYEDGLKDIEDKYGDFDFIKTYKKLNLVYNKKEIMSMIIDYNVLSSSIKEIADFKVDEISTEDKLRIVSEYFNKLPCLFDTMYHTFITEIKLLPVDLKIDFVDENRYEPFNKYIFKYLMYNNGSQENILSSLTDSIIEARRNSVRKDVLDNKQIRIIEGLLGIKEEKYNKWL